MEDEARAFVRSCDPTTDIYADYRVYMRYAGQGWEIPIDLAKDQALHPDAAVYSGLFDTGTPSCLKACGGPCRRDHGLVRECLYGHESAGTGCGDGHESWPRDDNATITV